MYLGMILVSFILLTLVFTFFELLGDIVRNHIPLIMVGKYLLNVTPSMIYMMAPLSVLLAVLTTFGLMQKTQRNYRDESHRNQHLPRDLPGPRHRRRHQHRPVFLRPVLYPGTPISARRPCATRSRASPRRPISVPTANGSLASTTPFTTTSFLIPTRTPSPISRPSSSIPKPSS